ncbi:jg21366, partial [Pararge aegeria aegeria]
VAELKDQLRDVMFFVEARGQLEKVDGATQDEIASASVTVQAPVKPRRRRR